MYRFFLFALSCFTLSLICASQDPLNSTSLENQGPAKRRSKRSNFESFLLAHTLNPSDPRNSYYEYWTVRDWEYWAKEREPLHDRANNYQGTPLTLKSCNAVIIATPSQVERAFEGPLYAYDRYNSIYWSNKRFRTYILQRDRRDYLNVYECDYLYFASRLVRGQPINFYAAFPTEYEYQTTSDLTEDLRRHCQRVPYSNKRYYSGAGGSSFSSYDNYNKNYNFGTQTNQGYGTSYYYSPDTSYRYYVGNGYASNYGWGSSGTARNSLDHYYTYDK